MRSARLHQLIERLSTLFQASFRAVASAHGLKQVQLEALVYLSIANRYSDTAASVSEYLGVTKGSISQTLKSLEGRGLIAKQPDTEDGRVVHCNPTAEGRAIVAEAYPAPLLQEMPAEPSTALEGALEALLSSLQAGHGYRSFGVCKTCRHFRRGHKGGQCGLTGEALSLLDVGHLCREHETPDAKGA